MPTLFLIAQGKPSKTSATMYRVLDIDTGEMREASEVAIAMSMQKNGLRIENIKLLPSGKIAGDLFKISDLPFYGDVRETRSIFLQFIKGDVDNPLVADPDGTLTCGAQIRNRKLINQTAYKDMEMALLKAKANRIDIELPPQPKQTSLSPADKLIAPYMPPKHSREVTLDPDMIRVVAANIMQTGFGINKGNVDRILTPYIIQSINETLGEIGMAAKFDGGSLSDDKFNLKLEIVTLSKDMEKAAFEKYCYEYGLKPHHYSRIISINKGKERVRLVGFDRGRRRWALEAQLLHDGSKIYLDPEQIVRTLNREDRGLGL